MSGAMLCYMADIQPGVCFFLHNDFPDGRPRGWLHGFSGKNSISFVYRLAFWAKIG